MRVTVTVNVTQSLIERGCPLEDYYCPVALAVIDAVPDLIDVSATHAYIAIRTESGPFRAPVPEVAADFMDRFDCGLDVEPISFDLRFEPADPTA